MKFTKTTKIIAIAAAFAALVACTKEPEPNIVSFEKGQKVSLNVSAGVPEVSEAKVSSSATSDAVAFEWEEGDKIKVSVGSSSSVFTFVNSIGDGEKGAFVGSMPASGSQFNVQYPVEDSDITDQNYISTEALPHDMMKFAATDCSLDSDVELSACYSGLKLNLYGTNQTVGKIVVTNTTSTETPQPKYTLNFSEGKELSTDSSNPTAFFIVVPAGTYDFSVEVFDNATTPASIRSFATTSAKEFTEGKILNMKAKAVKKITLSGAFTVSPGNDAVQGTDDDIIVNFSCGNLYYKTSDEKFYFEDTQYAYPSTWDPEDIGHFRWAKNSETLTTDINSAIGIDENNIKGTNYDVFFTNAITEDWYQDGWYIPRADFEVEGETGKWRTLCQDEYNFLLGIDSSDAKRSGDKAPDLNENNMDCRFAYVRIKMSEDDYIHGMLIFPDILTWPLSEDRIPENINEVEPEDWNNVTYYSLAEFTSLENAGCAFLPAAGHRSGTTMYNVGEEGDYWTCAHAINKNTKSSNMVFRINYINASGAELSKARD